jgi:hypothetical protein
MPYSRSSVEVLPDVGINASLPPSRHVLEKIWHIFVPAGREKEGFARLGASQEGNF